MLLAVTSLCLGSAFASTSENATTIDRSGRIQQRSRVQRRPGHRVVVGYSQEPLRLRAVERAPYRVSDPRIDSETSLPAGLQALVEAGLAAPIAARAHVLFPIAPRVLPRPPPVVL
ncbi:MAG: hypothetical protein FJW30_07490 [Acidobacteria bacterium]|nr:hypothetical protein [Acidobacteriota bacterium]